MIEQTLTPMGLKIIDFTREDAENTAALWHSGKKYGLSLADRACLATALRLNAKVITADRIWQEFPIELSIHLIR